MFACGTQGDGYDSLEVGLGQTCCSHDAQHVPAVNAAKWNAEVYIILLSCAMSWCYSRACMLLSPGTYAAIRVQFNCLQRGGGDGLLCSTCTRLRDSRDVV
jgi:hypothetical protein